MLGGECVRPIKCTVYDECACTVLLSLYRYVQQKTNSPVDMRVGIHTGAILAGILGQRQWYVVFYQNNIGVWCVDL